MVYLHCYKPLSYSLSVTTPWLTMEHHQVVTSLYYRFSLLVCIYHTKSNYKLCGEKELVCCILSRIIKK